jgi:hypothetical protein
MSMFFQKKYTKSYLNNVIIPVDEVNSSNLDFYTWKIELSLSNL